MNCEARFFVSNVAISTKNKLNNNETIIYNLFNFLFNFKNIKSNLKRIFILFFYKNTFFFTKFKFATSLNLNFFTFLVIKQLFFFNCFFSFNNDFYNNDIFSKSSYYILKIKESDCSVYNNII